MRVEETIRIAQPPESVWAVVAEPGNDPRWCRTVKSVDPVGDRRWRVMHKPIPLRPPRELDLKQLAAEPPRRLVLRQEDAAAVFNVKYRLEPTLAGTRFTQVSEFTWKTLPRVLHGTFGRAVGREVRGQLRALKALLERGGRHHGCCRTRRPLLVSRGRSELSCSTCDAVPGRTRVSAHVRRRPPLKRGRLMAAGAAARAVLVIGAQGVLGRALVRAFEEAGWRVLEACGEVMAPAAPPSWTSTAAKPWRRRSPALTWSLIPCRIPS